MNIMQTCFHGCRVDALDMAGDRMLKGLRSGDVDDFCFAVGQSIGLIHDVSTCEEVVDRMVNEVKDIIERGRIYFDQ